MSKALAKHSSIRQSGNSLVVTIPADIVREVELSDGDSVFWGVDGNRLTLTIVKLQTIAPQLNGQEEEA